MIFMFCTYVMLCYVMLCYVMFCTNHISTINNSVEVDPGEDNNPSFSGEITRLLRKWKSIE